MLHASFKKIAEVTQNDVFAFEYVPDPAFVANGHLYVLIVTKKEEDGSVATLTTARNIYAELVRLYYQEPGGTYSQLNKAVKGVLEKYGKEIQIAAASFVNGVSYVCVFGGIAVYLYRNGSSVKLIESNKVDVVCASGYPNDKDILFMGEPSFFTAFASKFQSIFTRDGIDAGAVFFSSLVARHQFCMLISFSAAEKPVAISFPENQQNNKIAFSPLFGKLKDGVRGIGSLGKYNKVVKIFENVEDVRKSKTTLTVAVVLLLLLLFSIGFVIRQKITKDYKASYENALVEAQHNFDEAQKLLTLNPSRSRELFIQSKDAVVKLLQAGVADERLTALNGQLSQKEGKILGEYDAMESLFVDLTLIDEKVQANDMASVDDQFVVLDGGGKRVVRVDYADKNTKVIAGPAQVESDNSQIAYYSQSTYLLDKNKVYAVGSDKKDIEDFENGSLIYGYAGNIYLLKKENSAIYRLPSITGGFASPTTWLASDQTPNFEKVVSWTIDGSIWLLENNGGIDKFTNGFEENFSYSAPFRLTMPTAIYTRDTINSLYVLEPASKRVVVLAKDGVFIAQYKNDKLNDALDIVVSEAEKILVFLTKDKLYSIELKHLD